MADKNTAAKIDALTIAFHELLTELGRRELITVTAIASVLEQKATATKVGAETQAALLAIVYKILHP
jgi:hypothetical protein